MGWERKRGKIEEFVRLLRGASDTSYVVQEGDLGVLPRVRYLITLDRDTRLPRGRRAHPRGHRRPSPEPTRASTRASGAWSTATGSCSRG